MESITQALARQARERPAALSLVDDRVRLTWGEVAAWVNRAAGWFRQHGFARGAPVSGWLPNCAEWYLLRLACEQAGLFWIPVPAGQGRRELASIAERVRPAALVSRERFRARDYAAEADEICAQLALRPLRMMVPDDGLLCLDGPLDDGRDALRLDEAAHALSTTGSAGIPKLATYTLAAACQRAHAQARLHGLRGERCHPGSFPRHRPSQAGLARGADHRIMRCRNAGIWHRCRAEFDRTRTSDNRLRDAGAARHAREKHRQHRHLFGANLVYRRICLAADARR